MGRSTAFLCMLLLSFTSSIEGDEPPSLADAVEMVTAAAGSSALLHCPLEFPGGVVRPYTVRWFKQDCGDPIYLWQEGEDPHVNDSFAGRLTLVGPASLALHDIHENDYGWYRCHVLVQSDVETEDARTVSWVLLESTEVGLHFTEEPQSVIVFPHEEVTLRCATLPATQLEWMKDDRRVNDVRDERLIVNGGELTIRPSIDSNSKFLNGVYRCIAHVAGSTLSSRSGRVWMAVVEAFPMLSDLTVEVAEGNLAVLPCHAPLSLPEGIVNIIKNGERIVSERLQRLQNGDFQVQSVRRSDQGAYKCSLENKMLNVSVEAPWKIYLVVTVPEGLLPTQLVVTPKKYLAVSLHVNVTLECRANGTPLPVVRWSKYGGDLPQQRHTQHMGTLSLNNIQIADEGTYVCSAENSYGPPVSSFTILKIQKLPALVRDLQTQNQNVTEGATVVLDCTCKGVPDPLITWIYNGEIVRTNDRTVTKDSKLILKKVSLTSFGFYQCFASNDVGTVQSAARLRVFPKISPVMADGQVDSSGSDTETHPVETDHLPHPTSKSAMTQPSVPKHDRQGSRKPKLSTVASKSKDKMVPPSRPEITKLSDESVMVRWTVPDNDGLPISFFKLQYKDVSRANSRWMTIDDEIASHIHSFEVSNLKLGHHYKFRIAAVYSNNDNKLGINSVKFHLQKDPPMKIPMTGPNIVHAEAVGPTAILIRWEYFSIDMIPIEGFFIYYRATTSAANYHKVTVIGGKTDKHIITHLEPKVTYEIKMQCFNLAGTSDFSNIWIQATLDYPYSRSDVEIKVATTAPVYQSCDEKAYFVATIVLGISVAILFVALCLCTRKHCQRHQTSDMAVHKIRKYDDAFHPNEFELQSLTGVKSLNGVSPTTNGHFLTNGCLATKPTSIGPTMNLSPEDEESFMSLQIAPNSLSAPPCLSTDDSVLESSTMAVPGRAHNECSSHSNVPESKLRLSTFGKSDDGCGTQDPSSIT